MDGRPLPIKYYVLAGVVTAGVVWIAARDGITAKEIGSGLLSLLGTFLGAFLAFRLNEHREGAKRRAEQITALNRGIFVLGRQINALRYIWTHHMRHFTTPIERAIDWPALRPAPFADLVQRLEQLEFLLDAHPATLMALSIEDERFHQALAAIHSRSNFHVSVVQPAVMNAALNRRVVNEAMLRAALGDQVYEQAMNEARIAYRYVEDSRKSLSAAHDELRRVAKELFPDEKFLMVEEPPEDKAPESTAPS